MKPVSITRIHGQMIISRALIATSFPVGAAITHGLEPTLLTLLRFALASLIFAPIVFMRYGFSLPSRRGLIGYAVISASLVVFFWCMFEALRTTTALNTGAIITLVPGISAIYAAILLRERLGKYRILAVLCGLIGALWVVFRGDLDRLMSFSINDGDLIFFVGCLSLGLYLTLVKRLHSQEPVAVMTLWIMVMGTGWLMLINGSAMWRTDWASVASSVYIGIAYLAVFTTIISFMIGQHAALHIGPTRTVSYNYVNPALVVAIEFLAGKGLPPLIVLPGVIIIFAATFVIQLGANQEIDSKR